MKKVLVLMLALIIATQAVACGQSTSTVSQEKAPAAEEKAPATDSEPKAEVAEMSGEDLEKLQTDGFDGAMEYVYIDVRPEEEYNKGHLIYAVNVLSDDIVADPEILAKYKDSTVILYCNTGKRSTEAAKALVEAGFTNVTNAQGVKDFPNYTLRLAPNVFGDVLQEAADSGEATIIDTTDQKTYDAGHLPGAILIDSTNIMNKDGSALDIEKFEPYLDQIPKDKPIYVHCWAGVLSGWVAEELHNRGYEVYNSVDGINEYDFNMVTE